jgi:hypothetical protein
MRWTPWRDMARCAAHGWRPGEFAVVIRWAAADMTPSDNPFDFGQRTLYNGPSAMEEPSWTGSMSTD